MALVFRIAANGGGGGGGGSYITPFAYYDFETSGSQYVTNVLGTNNRIVTGKLKPFFI